MENKINVEANNWLFYIVLAILAVLLILVYSGKVDIAKLFSKDKPDDFFNSFFSGKKKLIYTDIEYINAPRHAPVQSIEYSLNFKKDSELQWHANGEQTNSMVNGRFTGAKDVSIFLKITKLPNENFDVIEKTLSNSSYGEDGSDKINFQEIDKEKLEIRGEFSNDSCRGSIILRKI
jgi:hypothetical protein